RRRTGTVSGGRAGTEGPPPEVLGRFAGARVARLATVTPGGPRLVPVTFAWHRGSAVWAVDTVKPKRGRRLRRLADIEADPRVAAATRWGGGGPGPRPVPGLRSRNDGGSRGLRPTVPTRPLPCGSPCGSVTGGLSDLGSASRRAG